MAASSKAHYRLQASDLPLNTEAGKFVEVFSFYTYWL